jgi:hypothetical protein
MSQHPNHPHPRWAVRIDDATSTFPAKEAAMHGIQLLDSPSGLAYRDFANPGALSTTTVRIADRRAGLEAMDRRTSAGTVGFPG